MIDHRRRCQADYGGDEGSILNLASLPTNSIGRRGWIGLDGVWNEGGVGIVVGEVVGHGLSVSNHLCMSTSMIMIRSGRIDKLH